MRHFVKSQEGSILPIFAVTVVILIMVMAVAIDFSRFVMASEKLKTASDSAAVAAAMSARRYVRLKIDPGSRTDTCCGEDGCYPCCRKCSGPVYAEGTEEYLIDNQGYKKFCCSCEGKQSCGSVQIIDRWVVYENNGAEARAAAQTFFDINKPREMDGPNGGESHISSITVYNDRSSRLYPSVIVQVQGKLKTLMLNFMDRLYPDSHLSDLGTSKCSQGGTFYYDLDGKLHRAAESVEGCE